MAEKEPALQVPDNTHFSEWGIGEVLLALTGDQVDFRTAANQSWIKFDSEASGGSWDKSKPNSAPIQYHAWDQLYYAASYDTDALKAWEDLCLKMDTIANDLATGRRGSLDTLSVFEAEEKAKMYEEFLKYSASDFRAWAKNLDQDGSKFKGKAASVIQRRMDTYADAQLDVHKQVTDNNGVRVSKALGDLNYQLNAVIAAITTTWWQVGSKLRGLPRQSAYSSASNVTKFITENGLVAPKAANPNYALDDIVDTSDRDTAEEFIRSWLASTDYGNVMTADAWNKMNDEINKKISSALDELDTAARSAMADLNRVMVTATTALTALVEPTPSNSSGGGSNIPKPDGGGPKPPPMPDPNGGGSKGGDKKWKPPPVPDPNAGGSGGGDKKWKPPPVPDPNAGGSGGGDKNWKPPPVPDPNAGGSGGGDNGKPSPGFDSNGKQPADGGAPPPVPAGPGGVFTKSKQPGANGGGPGGLDENGKPLPGLDSNGKPLPGFDSNGKPLPGFDSNGKPLPGFDSNGKQPADGGAPPPVPLGPGGVFSKSKRPGANGGGSGGLDENGHPLPGFDSNGKPLPGFGSDGHPLPGFDSHGKPLPGFGSDGHPLPGFDSHGKPLPGFGSDGHP
ncbi:hypothetical protein ACWDKQ_28820, partial [Saccharopolyspora sp. NPDC000995]